MKVSVQQTDYRSELQSLGKATKSFNNCTFWFKTLGRYKANTEHWHSDKTKSLYSSFPKFPNTFQVIQIL